MTKRIKDLQGQKFGKLVVVEFANTDKDGVALWKCRCDCGGSKIVRSVNLRKGYTLSCGCLKVNDLTGKKFGRLTVIERCPVEYTKTGNKVFKWKCQCDCGNTVNVVHSNLIKGVSGSCGCMQKEMASKRFSTHRMRKTRIYDIYANMKQRCENPNNPRYKSYGGRGISVCPEWLGKQGVQNFIDWSMTNGYNDELTLDRIDNNKGYYPDNCRWTTQEIQRNNQRKSIWIEIIGIKKTLKQWTEFMEWEYGKYNARHRRGAEIFNEEELFKIKSKIRKE